MRESFGFRVLVLGFGRGEVEIWRIVYAKGAGTYRVLA